MKPLDHHLLREFVRRAAETVPGDWVVIGGTVLPLLDAGDRITLDIDFVPVGEAPQSDILHLMEIAELLDLPVETVNQVGACFLKKIPAFERQLVLVHQGSRGRIMRPDATLFILTKVSRLTESDLKDCLAMLQFARCSGEELDTERLQNAIRDELDKSVGTGRRERLERLLSAQQPPRSK